MGALWRISGQNTGQYYCHRWKLDCKRLSTIIQTYVKWLINKAYQLGKQISKTRNPKPLSNYKKRKNETVDTKSEKFNTSSREFSLQREDYGLLLLRLSVGMFFILFSIHFLGCTHEEFVWLSRASWVGDHFLYSRDLNVWLRSYVVVRI